MPGVTRFWIRTILGRDHNVILATGGHVQPEVRGVQATRARGVIQCPHKHRESERSDIRERGAGDLSEPEVGPVLEC